MLPASNPGRLPLASDPPLAPPGGVHPLLAKGFRPFFLLAATFAPLSLGAWLLALRGGAQPGGRFGGLYYHAHEMVFGFTLAVVLGFLLTAAGNWTKRETAVGWRLGALCLLWLGGRVLMAWAPTDSGAAEAVVDLALLPVATAVLAWPIIAERNHRNLVFVGLLAALFACNVGFHLGSLRASVLVAIDLIVVMMALMAGRIVPMFTRNGTGEDRAHSWELADRLTLVAVALVAFVHVAVGEGPTLGAVEAVACALTALRVIPWFTPGLVRVPLVWVLHLGHAFIPAGFGLRAAARFFPELSPSVGLHAHTAGAIGLLTLGMMGRVALGHTGRPIIAPRPLVVAFVLLAFGAVTRVVGPVAWPASATALFQLAGWAWAAAFALYVWCYLPIVVRPRVDGRPG